MDVAEARREAGLELLRLADEFTASDTSAFRMARVLAWVLIGVVTAVLVVLWLANADWRWLVVTWLAVAGLVWGVYGLSWRRQRQQTRRLRELGESWVAGVLPSSAGGLSRP